MKILETIKDFDGLVRNIRDLTAHNNHTDAVILLAQILKNKSAEKALSGVVAIDNFFGGPTQDLLKVRDQIFRELLDDIRHVVTKEDYDLIKSSF